MEMQASSVNVNKNIFPRFEDFSFFFKVTYSLLWKYWIDLEATFV